MPDAGSITIEQAVFTSARTTRADGYQLVARSPGVTVAQAELLTAWGPAHDSLLRPANREGSVNFQQLSEELWCLSKTTPAGDEYSGRGAIRIHTHCLLVGADFLSRFSNQPFRILDAASAAGHLRARRDPAGRLPAVKLRGRAAPTMPKLLDELAHQDTRRVVLRLAWALSNSACVLFVGEAPAARLFDLTLNILPVALRREVSFSTGLRHSSQRPFRLLCAPDDPPAAARLAKQLGAALFDVADAATSSSPLPDWCREWEQLIRARQYDELGRLLESSGEPAPI